MVSNVTGKNKRKVNGVKRQRHFYLYISGVQRKQRFISTISVMIGRV